MKNPSGLLLAGAIAAALMGSLAPPLVAARQESGSSPASSSAQMPGRPVYERVCSRCHGADGKGKQAPAVVPFGWNFSQALDIVRHGGPCGMPAFTESELADEELKEIVDYLKTLN
jgi:mono/diheme cytochrome c family protein